MSPPLANAEAKPSNTVMEPPRRIAISVQGAWKQYGSGKGLKVTPVLQGLNMTVREGTIYSLLGASGCGKTTLLACIVGMRRLDGGNCFIFGARPGTVESGIPGKRVGYMPQEIALYGEFTIREAMEYFGRIYGMSRDEVENKMSFLMKFLDLPPSHRHIVTLSGGQQRRVSFAVALLHDPEILILDEPTVGVDPLLRQNIWNHLSSLVSTGRTTVIITTHYIEEAKQANRIGLMRSGRLLAEDSPPNLLKVHQCLSLEDVFLKLCMKDKSNNNNALVPMLNVVTNVNKNAASPQPPNEINLVSVYNEKNRQFRGGENNDGTTTVVTTTTPEENGGIVGLAFHQSNEQLVGGDAGSDVSSNPDTDCRAIKDVSDDCSDCLSRPWSFNFQNSLNRLTALTLKNFICMWRNIGFMLFIFLLPAIQVILFCLAIGREPRDIRVGVINNEMSTLGLCDAPMGCSTANLSCRYLKFLPKDSLHLTFYENETAAISEIEKGNMWGYISFPSNFSEAMIERGISGNLADNETLHASRIKIKMDMSNQQIAFSLQRIFLETFQSFSKRLLSDCDYDPASGDLPLQFEEPVYGHDHPSFMEFLAPGIVLSIIFFMSVASTGSAFITEKKEGMMDRSLVAGVTTGEVITAHMITHYVVMVGQTALVFVFMMIVFEVPVRGPLVWAIAITLLQGTCGMAFGFLISVICTEERNAIQMALGSFYPNLLLSGVVWPIESMPKMLRDMAYIMPETLACESMRSILSRGWGITHPAVWPGFVASIVWSIIFWILAVLTARLYRSK
ncbi:ABC transporter G family member 20 isoform X3 [Folsomia candida]|nr:ABC transporter G family member 20 isoform X3 [Folsomia candida]